ncbi:hypothetical protein K2X92_00775 [Candidatus Gracilibacteria bacterium]|nr:hypothetical protein [Candidatus Gracilibacteria bacterium]
MYQAKHIIRKSVIVGLSFAVGVVSTVFAAATYDISVQTRANTIFDVIKKNASTMDQSDSIAYYNLVRLNIKSLVEVFSVVDASIVGELGLVKITTTGSIIIGNQNTGLANNTTSTQTNNTTSTQADNTTSTQADNTTSTQADNNQTSTQVQCTTNEFKGKNGECFPCPVGQQSINGNSCYNPDIAVTGMWLDRNSAKVGDIMSISYTMAYSKSCYIAIEKTSPSGSITFNRWMLTDRTNLANTRYDVLQEDVTTYLGKNYVVFRLECDNAIIKRVELPIDDFNSGDTITLK